MPVRNPEISELIESWNELTNLLDEFGVKDIAARVFDLDLIKNRQAEHAQFHSDAGATDAHRHRCGGGEGSAAWR